MCFLRRSLPPSSKAGCEDRLARRLLWIFHSAQILLFGAEFTQVYTKTYRSQVEPQEHAVKAEKKGIGAVGS